METHRRERQIAMINPTKRPHTGTDGKSLDPEATVQCPKKMRTDKRDVKAIEAMTRNLSEEPMELDDWKIGEACRHQSVGKDGTTLGLGAENPEDTQTEMLTEGQDGEGVAAKGTRSSDSHHSLFIAFLQKNLEKSMPEFRSFLIHVESYLERSDLEETKDDIGDILTSMKDRGIIGKGKYNALLNILKDARLIRLEREAEFYINAIHEAMMLEGQPIPPEYQISVEEPKSSARLHRLLKQSIHDQLSPKMSEYGSFVNIVKADLPRGRVATNQEAIVDILDMLEEANIIGIGKYKKLERILRDSGLKALQAEVAEKGQVIMQAMQKEGIPVEQDPQLPRFKKKKSSMRQHNDILKHISENLDRGEYKSFLTIARDVYLPDAAAETCNRVDEVLETLETIGVISKGEYSNLINILDGAYLNSLSADVRKMQTEIWETMLEEGQSRPEPEPESEADKILSLHNSLYEYVNRNLSPAMPEYKSFLTVTSPYIARGNLEANKTSVTDILRALQRNGQIVLGNYAVLLDILTSSSLIKLATEVEIKQKDIQTVMTNNGRRIPNISRDCISEKKSSEEQHRDLFSYVDSQLNPTMKDYPSFLTAARGYLPAAVVASNSERVISVLEKLQSEKVISKGNYQALIEILGICHLLNLRGEVEKKAKEIEKTLADENKTAEPVKPELLQSARLHRQLLEKVCRNLSPKMTQYSAFKRNMGLHLDKATLAKYHKSPAQLLAALETANELGVGNYGTLITILEDSDLKKLQEDVRRDGEIIDAELKKENPKR